MENHSAKKRTFSTTNANTPLPKITSSSGQPLKHTFESQMRHANSSLLISKRKILSTNQRIITEHLENSRRIAREANNYSQFTRHVEKMLHPQIQSVLQMFKTINLLRQKHGIISMKQDWQDDSYYLQVKEVPYSPQLRQMNQQICSLKRQIQDKIARIIKMVKPYPKLRHTVESLLDKSAEETLNQNSKVGKIAAMKAHRRLIENSRMELEKISKMYHI